MIIQVIINIVNNAIKYTPAGSEINAVCIKERRQGLYSNCDNGTGMDDDTKKHLFDMFYTASWGKEITEGLGLGLNFCRSIVTAHGGTISVSDNAPQGSVFTFTLPWEEIKIRSTKTVNE